MHRIYERFADMALSGEYKDFQALCRRLRVAPADLDAVIWDELGMDGQTLLEIMGDTDGRP